MYLELPGSDFFLFGMGPRRKLLYRAGALSDALSGELLQRWDVAGECRTPADYALRLRTRGGQEVSILEDEQAVWLRDEHGRRPLTQGAIHLPQFTAHPHRDTLRILHHEILINIVDGKPLPNFFVYRKPWRRDGAMMAMCLQRTGNIDLLRDWILSLEDPYDRNNAHHAEPDNLGQVLYLLSLVADRSHPLVAGVLAEAQRCRKGNYIEGLSDFAPHPVYQTKWLKFGLAALGLGDDLVIPAVPDAYSALFWWAYKDQHVPTEPFSARSRALYPYLGVAEDHFASRPLDTSLIASGYPLTWEAQASQADYPSIARANPVLADKRICMPHTWHAAELFLRFI